MPMNTKKARRTKRSFKYFDVLSWRSQRTFLPNIRVMDICSEQEFSINIARHFIKNNFVVKDHIEWNSALIDILNHSTHLNGCEIWSYFLIPYINLKQEFCIRWILSQSTTSSKSMVINTHTKSKPR